MRRDPVVCVGGWVGACVCVCMCVRVSVCVCAGVGVRGKGHFDKRSTCAPLLCGEVYV